MHNTLSPVKYISVRAHLRNRTDVFTLLAARGTYLEIAAGRNLAYLDNTFTTIRT